MQNPKNVRMPQGNAAGRLGGLIIGGGALLYGISNSLFNVEGGHRAIVFNRITGIKENVRDCSRHNAVSRPARPHAAHLRLHA